jgi:hypothetical protein
MKHFVIFSLLILALSSTSFAQKYTQTVRGKVIDKETQQPTAYATIALQTNGTVLGAISDDAGNYRIDNVPIGRATVQISFVGYESITIPNLEITSGRETILNVELVESAIKLEGVVVRAESNKEKPINTFASASARTFSVEEAQRYAGASYDVSRLAMNFAGVKSTDDTQNEIVIRGNSPIGMLFRLDGIDIPNPNHFGDGSASGGIVSMLNVNTLANSDFITGAFPAEYSNTTSGVFDLKSRNGNNQKHEFIGQLALMGTELSAEGPISKKNGSSYLVNYRYSTVQLLNSVVDLQMASLPTYQDGMFKLNFPSNGKGSTSIIGFGGTNQIDWVESPRDTSEAKPDMAALLNYDTDEYIDNKSGTIGVTHSHTLGERTYLRVILSASTVANLYRVDSVSNTDRTTHLWSGSKFQRTKYAAKFFVNTKLSSRNSIRAGITIERQNIRLNDSVLLSNAGAFRTLRNFNGADYIAHPYIQWQHRVSQGLRFNVGLSSNYQHSTGSFSVEPRAGLNWEPVKCNTFSLAYGLHSLSTPVEVLHSKILDVNDVYTNPNSDLGFTKSHHFVMSYDKIFSGKIRLKTEVYYQQIFDALVEVQSSSFSMLNRASASSLEFGALTNGGSGFNYGVELTAEKFMDKGTYFLSTLSLFESKYRGSDNVLRNTAFNGNYVFNLLAGKEFKIGSGAGRYVKRLNIDGKFNLAGGKRYSPIDLEVSRLIGYTQYDETDAYSQQMPLYLNINLRTGIKFIGKSTTQEIAINISNITNRKNPFFVKYDAQTDGLKTVYQFGLMPDILYRIVF